MLDLDGDDVEITSLAASNAYFDLDGNGFATSTAWVSGDDGFLALDKNGDGYINDINELFGNETQTGFEELATYDGNGDGVIDAQDAVFAGLQVWQDTNGDGISQASELSSLADRQIASIGLSNVATGRQAAVLRY